MSTPINKIDKCLHVFLLQKDWFLRYSGNLTEQKIKQLASNFLPHVLQDFPNQTVEKTAVYLNRLKRLGGTCNQVQFFRDASGGVDFKYENSRGYIEDSRLCIIAEGGVLESYTDMRADNSLAAKTSSECATSSDAEPVSRPMRLR